MTMKHLSAIKKSFPEFKSSRQVKKIFLAGVGAVGGTLLKQLSDLNLKKPGSVRVLGVCNSSHVQWYSQSKSEYTVNGLKRSPEKNWNSIIQKLQTYEKGSVIFVDVTGDTETADLYPDLLKAGIHVVTASKLANTRSQDFFNTLHSSARQNEVQFLYETNVGAGLPIIRTIKSLIETGDDILEISGVLSGTMTYLFSEMDKGIAFSNTVIRARALGYAEPDPRDDLSGEDVVRKFIILARICGHQIERSQVESETLIPDKLMGLDASLFLEKLPESDTHWQKRLESEHSKQSTLRYVGHLKDGKIRIGVESVKKSSAFGQLSGTNNLIQIKTKRYHDQPIIIQGPGAGKEVTATGVLADILRIEV